MNSISIGQDKQNSALRFYTVNISKYMIENEIIEQHGEKSVELLKSLGLECPCPIDKLISTISEKYIDVEYREGFIKHFDRKELLLNYSRGRVEVVYDYRTDDANGRKMFVRHTIILIEDPSSRDIYAVCCTSDISNLTSEQRKYTKVRENVEQTLHVIEGLTNDYDTIWIIDGGTLDMHLFKTAGSTVIPGAVEIGMKYANYDEVMRNYVAKYVCDQDKERVLQQADSKYILGQLEKNDVYTMNYLRQNEDGIVNYHQMIFAKTKSKNENEKYVLAFKSVDEAVRQEMEQVAKNERIKQYEADARNMDLILDSLGSGGWNIEFDEKYEISKVFWSDTFRRILGYKNEKDFPNEIESWTDLLYGDDRERVMQLFNDSISDISGKIFFDTDFRMYTKKSGVKWFHSAGRISRRADGSPITFIGLLKDIDDEKQNEIKFKEQLEIVEALSRDYRNIYKIDLNTRSTKIVKMEGYVIKGIGDEYDKEYSYDALLRMYVKEIVHPEDMKMVLEAMKLEKVRAKLNEANEYASSYRAIIDGEIHYYQFTFLRLNDNDNKNNINKDNIIVGFKNIDSVVKAARERESLIVKSETDLMTSLLNRKSGELRTIEQMKMGGMFSIIDIDYFKHFNDTYGHSVGDKVIIAVSSSLKEAFRDKDIIYRLGGDEFTVFAQNINDEEVATQVLNRYLSILENVEIPEIADDKITLSIGVRIIEKNEEISFEELYKTTDACTYGSKDIPGSHITFYHK